MITVSASIWIDRSIDDVFDYSNDFERTQEWQQDVIRSEITSDGPMGVGSTGIFAQKMMGREVENEMEITSYEPPYEVCFKSTSGPISFDGCQTYEEDDGGTLTTMHIDGEVGGFFKLAEGMVQNQVQKSIERDLANLKAILEG